MGLKRKNRKLKFRLVQMNSENGALQIDNYQLHYKLTEATNLLLESSRTFEEILEQVRATANDVREIDNLEERVKRSEAQFSRILKFLCVKKQYLHTDDPQSCIKEALDILNEASPAVAVSLNLTRGVAKEEDPENVG